MSPHSWLRTTSSLRSWSTWLSGPASRCVATRPHAPPAQPPPAHPTRHSPVQQEDEITHNLIAWLVYLAKQVATVSTRKKGRVGVGNKQRGDMEAHTHWNKGIASALKFMSDPLKCPTRSPMVLELQGKKRKFCG